MIPYVAAAGLGIVPAAALDTSGYAAAMPAWRSAMRAMAALRPGDDLEPMRFAIWRAHLASIELAVLHHASELEPMAEPERTFARGWIRMVDLFGAAAFRTDLVELEHHRGGALPPRMLRAGDTFADFSPVERRVVRGVIARRAPTPWRMPRERALWERIMRTRPARDEVDAGASQASSAGGPRGVARRELRALAYATSDLTRCDRVSSPYAMASRRKPWSMRRIVMLALALVVAGIVVRAMLIHAAEVHQAEQVFGASHGHRPSFVHHTELPGMSIDVPCSDRRWRPTPTSTTARRVA